MLSITALSPVAKNPPALKPVLTLAYSIESSLRSKSSATFQSVWLQFCSPVSVSRQNGNGYATPSPLVAA